MILLEHTAGQGSAMGSTFEQIAAMLDGARKQTRLGVCLDTCHLLASGYDLCTERWLPRDVRPLRTADWLRSPEGVPPERLEEAVPEPRRSPRAHRKGCIGLEPFRRLLNDPRFAHLPMIIETEKTEAPRADESRSTRWTR